jgi:chromosome segregation ATPase
MIDTKELRDRAATFGSDYLTDEEWVEVIDRLDVAEKELESWKGLAQQLGNEVGALRFRLERRQDELNRLRANLESAEKERDALRAELADLRSSMTFRTSLIGRIEAERDALQAKVEAMERQKPVTAQSALAEAIIADMQAQHDSELITENDSGEALIRLDGAIAAVEDNFALAQPASSMASSDVSLMQQRIPL